MKEEKDNKKEDEILKFTGILFELKIGLNKDNAVVIDYGGKPVTKIRDALKGYPFHANSVGKKLQDDVNQIIQEI